jgi:hypothetical protein
VSDPFRDDHAQATRFSSHVAVAEDILDRIERIPGLVEAGAVLTQETLNALVRETTVGWENAWDQLQQARDIAAAKGRDVSAFDSARAEAGDIWNNIAFGKSVTIGRDTHVTWRSVPTRTARAAIAALRAAMPEIVVTQQPALDVDLRPTANKALEIAQGVAGIAVIAGVVYFLYRAFAS